jgi:Uma2 family endonuclease
MSVVTEPNLTANGQAAGVPNDFIWRLSVEQYHEMLRAGILTPDDPVELLEGWLVFKMGKNPPHVVATNLVRAALERLLLAGWFVGSQDPVTTETSEPEPDVAVVRGSPRQYYDRHPGPRDVALVVEIADATLRRDQEWKRRIYAAAGIPVYWIVNLPEKVLEVYMTPSGPADQPGYQQRLIYKASDEVSLVIEGQEVGLIAVRELLP